MTDRVRLQEELMIDREQKLNDLTKELNQNNSDTKRIKQEISSLENEEKTMQKLLETKEKDKTEKLALIDKLQKESQGEKHRNFQVDSNKFE